MNLEIKQNAFRVLKDFDGCLKGDILNIVELYTNNNPSGEFALMWICKNEYGVKINIHERDFGKIQIINI